MNKKMHFITDHIFNLVKFDTRIPNQHKGVSGTFFFLFLVLGMFLALSFPSHAIVTGGDAEDAASWGGVVRFGEIENFLPNTGCSGVLISPTLILTAAHCVSNGEFSQKIFMQRRGSRTTQCITIQTTNAERPCVARRLFAVRHPSYRGEGDVESDIALVHIINNSFQFKSGAIPKDNFARLYSDTLHHSVWMLMAGFGPTMPSGVGHGEYHESRFKRTWIGDHHFFYKMGPRSRVCKGDSGGPAYLIAKGEDTRTDVVPLGKPVVVGLLSTVVTHDNWCGRPGKKARWVKVSPKVEWISQVAESRTGRACRPAIGKIADVNIWLCFD